MPKKPAPKKAVKKVKEEIEEVPVQAEAVEEVFEEVKPMTEEELQDAIRKADAEKAKFDGELIKIRMERNKNLIKVVQCMECGAPLNIDPEPFMSIGTTVSTVVCPVCDVVNRVAVTFVTDPEQCDPQIKQQNKGLDFMITQIGELTEDQIKKRIAEENKFIEIGRHKSDPRLQLVIRAINEIINK